MLDNAIVALYFDRNEQALEETASKYGKYCFSIAYNILSNQEDAEESVNDTYLDAWNSMPPHRPSSLSLFLGKITRRISIDKWRRKHAKKRGGGEVPLVLEELRGCLADSADVERDVEQRYLAEVINRFLKTLPVQEQRVFLCRYWYLDSIGSICKRFGYTEAKVKSMLHRTREKLRKVLEQEGF